MAEQVANPGTVIDENSVGTTEWSDVNNVKIEDTTNLALVSLGSSDFSLP